MHELVILIARYFVFIPIIVWLFLFIRVSRQQRVRLLILSVIAAVIALGLVKIATTVHQDPRPFVRDGVTPYFASSKDNGFPSDHTTFAALLAGIVFVYRKTWGITLLIIAIMLGSARVISGVHHGQDVIGGLIIAGAAVGMAKLILPFVLKLRSPNS